MFTSIVAWAKDHKRYLLVGVVIAIVAFIGWQAAGQLRWLLSPRTNDFFSYYNGNQVTQTALTTPQQTACAGAPFIIPAEGFIGLFYGDPRGPYSVSNPHQGVDIFAPEPGTVPIYAAYDGYITRQTGWISSVIMRVPDDPLNPGQQIWLYYTHMADITGETSYVQFPPGTRDQFVEQGTLIGYIGDYNGGSSRQVSPHLHFSIVRDDGSGQYLNELDFANTLDPSPYFGMAMNYGCDLDTPLTCTDDVSCPSAIRN